MKLISSTLALSAVLLSTFASAQSDWPINLRTWRNFVMHGEYYSFNGDFSAEPKRLKGDEITLLINGD